ncbi:MAG TPA: hypothetical protein VMJ10_10985 [Kofleriaceae bacterium]|nr:hypothetical protein [Kofleriaceae bacterium]
MSLDTQVGTQVTIDGTARNAALGAVVVGEKGMPIYIAGLERWDRTIDGKPVSVSGKLTKVAPDDVVDASGQHAHGAPGARFVLEQASWTVK